MTRPRRRSPRLAWAPLTDPRRAAHWAVTYDTDLMLHRWQCDHCLSGNGATHDRIAADSAAEIHYRNSHVAQEVAA